MTVFRGEVVYCDLNPVIGTEQAGIRPCVVLQNDRANQASPHTIIAPCTTRIRTPLLPSHVLIRSGDSGLSQDSVLLCEQIRVIDRRRIVRTVGKLDEAFLAEIAKALRSILELS